MVVIDVVIFTLELLQVRVVVACNARSVIVFIDPGVGVHGVVADHIAHGASARCIGTDAVGALIIVPFCIFAFCPVRAVGINILATDDVQFVSLEVVGCWNCDCRTVDLGHGGL